MIYLIVNEWDGQALRTIGYFHTEREAKAYLAERQSIYESKLNEYERFLANEDLERANFYVDYEKKYPRPVMGHYQKPVFDRAAHILAADPAAFLAQHNDLLRAYGAAIQNDRRDIEVWQRNMVRAWEEHARDQNPEREGLPNYVIREINRLF